MKPRKQVINRLPYRFEEPTMNKNDFRNPLIQSGIILLVVFLLIAIVANAEPSGTVGSIAALVKGLFMAILYVIALIIGIIFCIAVLIGLFIAALSINSVDKARDFFNQFMTTLKSNYNRLASKLKSSTRKAAAPATGGSVAQPQSAVADAQIIREVGKLENGLIKLETLLGGIQNQQTAVDERISDLQDAVTALKATNSGEQVGAHEASQSSLADSVKELSADVEAGKKQLGALEARIDEESKRLESEVAKLHKKTSVPEVVSGILSYIDLVDDRDKITEKAEEAISRGMTYSQIDDFFKSSLDKGVYKVLAEHPRLTKDFLRSIKKKFN